MYVITNILFLYDEGLRLICNDTPQLREAVQVVDGFLQIDSERMDACLKELEIEGEYVLTNISDRIPADHSPRFLPADKRYPRSFPARSYPHYRSPPSPALS